MSRRLKEDQKLFCESHLMLSGSLFHITTFRLMLSLLIYSKALSLCGLPSKCTRFAISCIEFLDVFKNFDRIANVTIYQRYRLLLLLESYKYCFLLTFQNQIKFLGESWPRLDEKTFNLLNYRENLKHLIQIVTWLDKYSIVKSSSIL